MKRYQNIILALSAVAGVSFLSFLAYQPISLAKATGASLTEGEVLGHPSFTAAYTPSNTPSTNSGFFDAEVSLTQTLIAKNSTDPFPTLELYDGVAGSVHKAQGCAVAYEGWTIIYGSNNLTRDFRLQKITTTSPRFIPLGFFLGIHGIRKITFTVTGMADRTDNLGSSAIAVCVASLDGTSNYPLPCTKNTDELVMGDTTNTATTYTFTLPEQGTSWTPRWIYVGGSFLAHNLGTDSGSTKEEDLNTYYCDLISFIAYFDGTC